MPSMNDPDVFAVLTPFYEFHSLHRWQNTLRAFSQSHNAARYHKAATPVTPKSAISDQEEPPTRDVSPAEANGPSADCIMLKFSDHVIDLAKGLQFGRDLATSDVLLQCPGVKGVSARHFNIVVKADQSWYLEDSSSSCGTTVDYDGKTRNEKRQKEKWIVAHPPTKRKQWEHLTVHAGDVAFVLEFPNQHAGNAEYIEKLEAFVAKSTEALPPVEILGLQSNSSTAAPSGQKTPLVHERPIYVDKGEIGKGGFSVVSKAMSNRDGKLYAMKNFTFPSEAALTDPRKRKENERIWKGIQKEYDILCRNAHPNVMPAIDLIEKPKPALVTPYYELGSLESFKPVDKRHTYRCAFLQTLLALRWLHSRGIIHRDIKPENFLVESAQPLKIVIADFGLSKESASERLQTFCGTAGYCAPEMYPGNSSDGYGKEADIWSLGIMMLRLMHGLPTTSKPPPFQDYAAQRTWASIWTQLVQQELITWTHDSDLVKEIIENMVEEDPTFRPTADECLQAGLRNGLFRRDSDDLIVTDVAEVATPAEVAWQTDSSEDSGKTLGLQSPQSKHPSTASYLPGALWEESGSTDHLGDGVSSTGSNRTFKRLRRAS